MKTCECTMGPIIFSKECFSQVHECAKGKRTWYGKNALHMKLIKYYFSKPPEISKQSLSMPLISLQILCSLPNFIYPTPDPWDHLFFETFFLRLHFWELNTPHPTPTEVENGFFEEKMEDSLVNTIPMNS